ncbi:uncharacterized protein A4U43_C04F21910 [Asparagus officinalis]|uniref:Uncharacterized protein n=1 Tax=Asparagus officinalis TaxID=4686 RepID=A0A5P1F2U8_ASPOF|nr:uncharacterized protein A4U43_C04F21910 [Asparagus officinalis]
MVAAKIAKFEAQLVGLSAIVQDEKFKKRRRRLSRSREPQWAVDKAQVDSIEVAKEDVSASSPKDGPSPDIPFSKIADVVILDEASPAWPEPSQKRERRGSNVGRGDEDEEDESRDDQGGIVATDI